MKLLVQVGSNDGTDIHGKPDLAAQLILNEGYYGHLIEPNDSVIPELRKTYRSAQFGSIKIHTGFLIGPRPEPLTNFFVASDNRHSSVNDGFAASHGDNTVKVKRLPVITLSEFFAREKISKLNTLIVDTEGGDFDIIMSAPFDQVYIKTVVFEHLHLSGPNKIGENFFKIVRFLTEKGFHFIDVRGFDTAMTRT